MTEKRQTSQGYIIPILQHFATKSRNITNFVMLFQAVMKFLSSHYFLIWLTNSETSELYVYIWCKNFSHSAYVKNEAKMAELTSNNYEDRKQFSHRNVDQVFSL